MNIDFCRKNGKCETYHFLRCYIRYGPLKTKVKSQTILKTIALRRQMIALYENKIKYLKSNFRNYFFNVFTLKQAIQNSTNIRVICPFSDMTLHFLDLTKTGN